MIKEVKSIVADAEADAEPNLTKFGEARVIEPAPFVIATPAPGVIVAATGFAPVDPINNCPFVKGPKLVIPFEAAPTRGAYCVTVTAEKVPEPLYFANPVAFKSIELFVGMLYLCYR